MNNILSAQRREKGSRTKSLVPCPKVAKLCNSSMSGVEVMFYLRIFFDLMDIACVNSYFI